jgi:hypothetical protein
MTLFNCLDRAMNDPEVSADRERGERAQKLWRELSDRYERAGFQRHNAEVLAADDVKEAFKRETAERRHVFLAQIAAARRSQALVENSKKPATLLTDSLELAADSPNQAATVIGTQRALMRQFHKRLQAVIQKHNRDLLGRNRDQAQLINVVRELHGESTGDGAAYVVAEAVRDAFEDMRLMFNEAGGVIRQLENWGLPHSHNRAAIRKAGFDAWAAEVAPRLSWDKIEDGLTGRPLAQAGEIPPPATVEAFLREAWSNIVFGRVTDDGQSTLGRGASLWKRRAQERVLPFRDGADWVEYNRRFGTGDPFSTIIGHAHRMARDIALAREFGPNPVAGFQSRARLLMDRARAEARPDLAERIEGNAAHAERMLKIYNGSLVPAGPFAEAFATFMSSTRHALTAAFLDRAIIASLSDLNTMRMSAKAVGMNPQNVVSRHVKLMADTLTREEAARAGWIADTLADPGAALARFQSEVPPAAVAERLSQGVMRLQGLAFWTDQARIAFQMEMAGLFAANAGRTVAQIEQPLRGLLQAKGITDAEWQAFTDPALIFKTTNGATFASPIYWRAGTTLPRREADDLFTRLQGIIEEQTEFAVPTGSTWARAFIEGGMPPGSIGYELLKSGTMFKAFPLTFTVNQYRRTMSFPTIQGRIGYALDLAAGGLVMGALSLQLVEIVTGNDPQDMTQPRFWAAAALRAGSFGVLGDALAATQSPFGGLAGYAAGPVLGLADDLADLTLGNVLQAARGNDTNFGRETLRFINRYLPGGDLPFLGVAADRLLFDQMQLALDPDSVEGMAAVAKRKREATGANAFWLPGAPLPSRGPDLGSAISGASG